MAEFTYIGAMKIKSSAIKNDWAVIAYRNLEKQTPEEALQDYNSLGDDIQCLMDSEGYTVDQAYDSILNNLADTALGI